MSFFEDASLVLIPSAQKTSKVYSVKPTDGTGDLTFTRSNDTATRVNSAGLIEKVRTNLLLQSNTFSTTWTASNASVTSGQAGYDGTNNAWLLSKSAASGYISQGPASSGSETISVYAKAGTDNWLHILVRDSASVFFGGYWDLQNGVVGSAIGATTLRIESVGNGWYRCSASFVKSTSNYYRIYPAEGNNDTSGTSGNILIQAAQLETGDIATDYIPTTTAAVSVGPVANVPRLDYLNSSCPRLLLEPQRTNLYTFSEQLNQWSAIGTPTVTANYAVSPDGYSNADRVQFASGNALFRSGTGSAGENTLSVYAKATNGTSADFRFFANGATTFSSNQTATGEWQRFTFTYTFSSITAGLAWPTSGTGATDVIFYGFQHEIGAYATSYIPTLGAAVTRGADGAYKTGISSLIGQTEGTIFIDFVASAQNQDGAAYSVITILGTNTENIQLYTNGATLLWYAFKSTIVFNQTANQTLVAGQRYKVAYAYKSGDWALYINGVQKRTRTDASVPATSQFNFNTDAFGVGPAKVENKFNQALLFKTRLSNADLAALTTI